MDNIYVLNKERGVLSTLIDAHMNNLNLETVFMSGLKPDMFYLPAHQKIFELISLYYNRNKAYDIDNIMRDINEKDVDHSILVEITSVLSLTEKLFFDDIDGIKEEYQKRKYIEMCSHIKKLAIEDQASSDTIKQFIENSINNLSFIDTNGYTKKLTDVRAERKTKPERTRIKTYIPFIDTVFTKKGKVGIKRGSLGFISGLKESGKTFTLTRLIENVSKDHPVLFGSMEFGKDDYDENIEEQQEDNYFNGNTDNIFIFDDVYDINKIVAEIRFQHKVNNIQLVALDSMLRITNNDPSHATNEKKLSDVFSKLGKLAKELDIPIIIIVQSSKEDLKSSIVSVKGCMDADHEAYWWYHLYKTHKNKDESEQRTVIWVKNKDTKKHPKQHLMFVPQTKDFYRIEIDKHGNPCGAIDNYRKPKFNPAEPNYSSTPQITVYEAAGTTGSSSTKKDEEQSLIVDMPEIEF